MKARRIVTGGDGERRLSVAQEQKTAAERACNSRGGGSRNDADDDDEEAHGDGVDFEDETSAPATPSRLTVTKLPALVREVDILIQTLMASPPQAGSHDLFELCASILSRVDEVDTFRQTLRPGPLEAIVHKQVKRLEAAVQLLQSPSQTRRDSFLGMQMMPPRIVPASNTRKPRASQKPILARKHNEIRITRAPKPIYKWERRCTAMSDSMQHSGQPNASSSSSSSVAASATQGLRNALRQLNYVDEDNLEAAMELRPCKEPGHYLRGASAFSVDSETRNWIFEFQLILTEEELKSLKFQRRRLEAEQRHLQRQQQLQDPKIR